MTEKRLRELFATWKHRLGLDLWYLEVREGPGDSETSPFEVHRSTQYNRAVVFYKPWVLTGKVPEDVLPIALTDDRVEESVVHELLHCTRHHSYALVIDRIDGQVHRDVYTVYVDGYRAAQELEIENLAVALVKAWHEK